MKNIYQTIQRPIITEKSMRQTAQNKYTFEVNKKATKKQIKRAVQKTFGVDVLNVQTINVKGKAVRRGPRRVLKKKSDWKKAIVTLKEGDKVEVFEQ